jgi:TAP-like protein
MPKSPSPSSLPTTDGIPRAAAPIPLFAMTSTPSWKSWRPGMATVGAGIRIDKDVFAGAVRRMLMTAEGQSAIPGTIAAARRGDFSPLSPMLRGISMIDRSFHLGLFLSVTCAEDAPFFTAADIESASRGTFSGGRLATAIKEACADWPSRSIDRSAARRPVRIPAVYLAGALDPPLTWTNEMAALTPNHRIVKLEGMAHEGSSECLRTVVTAFVASGTLDGLPVDCAAAGVHPPFRTPLAK